MKFRKPGRAAKGTAIVNLLQLDGGEKVTAMIAVPEEKLQGSYLIMATRQGTIKRTELSEFVNLRKSGLIAIVLREDDDLIGVALTDGRREVLLGTRDGMSIRFAENGSAAHRPKRRGRAGHRAGGGRPGGCHVASWKRTPTCWPLPKTDMASAPPCEEYRLQSRAGKGIKAMNLTDKTGGLAGQLLVRSDEDILIITDDGTIIRTPVDSIPLHGRATQGVRLMRVAEGSRIMSIERAEQEPEEDELIPEGEELQAPEDEI